MSNTTDNKVVNVGSLKKFHTLLGNEVGYNLTIDNTDAAKYKYRINLINKTGAVLGFVDLDLPTEEIVHALKFFKTGQVDQGYNNNQPLTQPTICLILRNGEHIHVAVDRLLDGVSRDGHKHVIADVTDLQTALNGKANVSHTHTIPQITGLQDTLNGKANTSHTHTIANVTGLQDALDGKANTSHTHTIANVTGLQDALNGKANTSHTHTIAQITNLQTTLDGKADISHNHDSVYLKLTGGTLTGNLTGPAFYESSDARLKDVLGKVDSTRLLHLLFEMQCVKYRLKGDDKEQIGVIAQEVQKYFPELVHTDDKGYLSIAYDRLAVLALRACQILLGDFVDFSKNTEKHFCDIYAQIEELQNARNNDSSTPKHID